MQNRMKVSFHRRKAAVEVSPSSSSASSAAAADAQCQQQHLKERARAPYLYPAYGIVYALARRERIVYPAVVRLIQFVLLSAILCAVSLALVTPVTVIVMKICSFNLLPFWLLVIPAVFVALLFAAFGVLLSMHRFKHSVDQVIVSDVNQCEGLDMQRNVLEQPSRNRICRLAIWLAILPIVFIPVVGVPCWFWLRGLMKANNFAQARISIEHNWTHEEKCRFRFRQIWHLQIAGFVMSVIETIPFVGPIFIFTDLVAKALYVADSISMDQNTASSLTQLD